MTSTNKVYISKLACAFFMVLVLLFGQISVLSLSIAVADEPAPAIENCGPRLNAPAGSSYQWQISATADGEYVNIEGATDAYYDISAADEGKYIQVMVDGMVVAPVGPIGKLVTFDLAQGFVQLGENGKYSGFDFAGNPVAGDHALGNIYVIGQSSSFTTNNIVFSGNYPDTPFDVTLDGVNMGQDPGSYKTSKPNGSTIGKNNASEATGFIHIPAQDSAKNVTLRLKGENVVRYIHYYTGKSNEASSLKITDFGGDGATSGSLYVPVKVADEDIDAFVAQDLAYNHWNSGIGGDDGGGGNVRNLHIAGGRVQVLTTYGDNCTAIGAGGNDFAEILISGGEVIAHSNGTGAAIGGGIGWNSAGGYADIKITGGKVYAKNHGEVYTKGGNPTKDSANYDEVVGGVAIGAGSSFKAAGNTSPVVINISGGEVEAYGTFGNGIGGGNSSSSTGGEAKITISGGKVKASSIGGGDSKTGTGGKATVNVSGAADVSLTRGIGGGDSKAGDGGNADIAVSGGRLVCGGTIGGGSGGVMGSLDDKNTGDGGNATINVSGGYLEAKSIGGGTGSEDGHGGSVAGVGDSAGVIVSGGTIVTGSIGGGSTLNPDGKIGYATANISGGEISGQFLMAAGGTDPCSFVMTGGRLYGVDTSDASIFTYVQQDGAAVYMDDPNGIVSISGGTIEECKAANGGAVYMTAGTFNLSGDGVIRRCEAAGDGGAVYLGGGAVNVTGGSVTQNEAANNGGGIAVINGNYRMVGGSVDGNMAENGNGGGIYVAANGKNVTVDVLSGSVSSNTSSGDGGAFAVVGNTAGSDVIDVTIGINKLHDSGASSHDGLDNAVSLTGCPVIKNNKVTGSGGAVYVTGSTNTTLGIYCIDEAGNDELADGGQSTFMKMDGGRVIISASDPSDLTDEGQTSDCGNINITGNMYVTGGQIDLWGDTDNPRISGVMTVDIEKEGDHFKDHRRNEGYYKLVYYENFEDPTTGVTTGQYKAFDVVENSKVTISGVIYSHPGYQIMGWYTDKEGAEGSYSGPHGSYADPTLGKYEVNEEIVLGSDLTIYADWEPVGYEVYFDPNVPEGGSYTGSMDTQIHEYGIFKALTLNDFGRAGYQFTSWNTQKDGSGDSYADGEEVKNLTSQRGATVTLYAQWVECDHGAGCVYTYSLEDGEKTLRRDCSCDGYYETVSLSASDAVFDKSVHEASVAYSSKEWKPQVSYTKKVDSEYVASSAPINAGSYTASVTVSDVLRDDGSVGSLTACVTYEIHKAPQPAPNAPTYVANIDNEGGVSKLQVNAVADSDLVETGTDLPYVAYDSKKQYQVVYYVGDERVETGWVDGQALANGFAAEFEMNVALTNYYVYARYSEGANYQASDESRSEGAYFFTGNVVVYVTCGEGVIEPVLRQATEGTNEQGVMFDVVLKEGYYLPDGFTVSAVTKQPGGADHATQATVSGPDANGACKLDGIPNSCEIYITIPDAKKAAVASARVEPGQVFGNVQDENAKISRDSAYTAYFEVEGYDSSVYSGGAQAAAPAFSFSNELPAGTKLILVDKTSSSWGYYAYTATTNIEGDLPLSSFGRMGVAEEAYSPAANASTLKLQLVVDFSAIDKGYSADSSSVTLNLEANEEVAANAEDVSATATAQLVDAAGFTLSCDKVSTGLAKTFSLGYAASQGEASKWKGRATALVLVSEKETELPADAKLICAVGGSSFTVYPTADGVFYVPVPRYDAGSLTVTLSSSLFPDAGAYAMDTYWMVALSEAASSPGGGSVAYSYVGGEKVLANLDVVFTAEGSAKPSVKVECFDSSGSLQRSVDASAVLGAQVQWADVSAGKMTLTLMRKDASGGYASTAFETEVVYSDVVAVDGICTKSVPVELKGTFGPGSYCLELSVMNGLVEVANDRYYFIIEEPGTSA